jgi:hypothetical protein
MYATLDTCAAPHTVPVSCREAVSPPLAHPEGVACTPEGCGGPGLAASRRIPEGDERGAGSSTDLAACGELELVLADKLP